MTTNAVPSSSPADLLFNAGKIDEAVNTSNLTYVDRLGVVRKTLAGAVATISATNPRGAWVTATAYAARDVVQNSSTWYLALDAHTSGETFSGDQSAHWRVYQGVTAAELADGTNVLNGDALVAVQRTTADTVDTTIHDWIETKPLGLRADFGVIADGSTDQRAVIIDAMVAAAAAGRMLDVEAGVYAIAGHIPLITGLRMRWLNGAKFKLTSATSVGGFITGAYTGVTPVPISDIRLWNPVIDCNSQAGENGFGIAAVQDLRIYHPEVYNTLHSTSTLGGRAFQFEGDDIVNIHVVAPHIEDCSIGINSHADSAAGSKKARHIVYSNVTMKTVCVPFNVDSQFANPQNGVAENMSTHVVGASLFNCGRLTWSGATATGGGIICGDRGFGLRVSGLRVVNEASYGAIGALIRGRVYGIELSDAQVDVPSMTAVYDFNEVGFGSPGAGAASTTAFTQAVTVKANLDYVVKGSTGGIGAARLHCALSGSAASLTGLVDTNGASASAIGEFTDTDNGSTTGRMSLSDIVDAGNAIGSFWAPTVSGIRSLTHSKSINDESATQFLKVLAPVHSRTTFFYSFSLHYPSAANDAALRAATGMIVATRDGAGNATAIVKETDTTVALDAVASQAITVSVALVSGEFIVSVTQNNESADAPVLCMGTIQIHHSVGSTAKTPTVTKL